MAWVKAKESANVASDSSIIYHRYGLFMIVFLAWLVTACGGGGGESGTDPEPVESGSSQTFSYYRDVDQDGFGNATVTMEASSQPAGYVANSSDCDDENESINPSAVEINDGLDNDCDGLVDEGFSLALNLQQGKSLWSGPMTAIVAVDIDGDGDRDLLAGNEGANRVYLNDGSARFTDSGQMLGQGGTTSLQSGDIDGDGDPDLVEGNRGGIVVYFNDGNGGYSAAAVQYGSPWASVVTMGDLNGDGAPDLVAANNNGQANRILLNDGSGRFTDSGQALGNAWTNGVALADVDGDGDLDLLAGNTSGYPSRLYLNDGRGIMADSGQSVGSGRAVAFVDVDGDDDADILSGSHVFLNDGAGVMTDSGQVLDLPDRWVTADVDGDGDIDLLAGGKNRIFLNDGSGRFLPVYRALGSSGAGGVVLADLDNDGDIDAVTGVDSGSGQQANAVYLNDGNGQFTASVPVLGGSVTHALAVGDFNDDGYPDLIENNTGGLRRHLHDGDRGFVDDGEVDDGIFYEQALALEDLDMDSDLDLVVLGRDTVKLLLNDGSGHFVDSLQSLPSPDINVASGDIDGDGDSDLIAGQVYLNAGDGTFSAGGQTFTGVDTTLTGDLDGDGDLDLLLDFRDGYHVYLNNGAGQFTDRGQVFAGDASGQVTPVLGDLDGDGDLDFVLGSLFWVRAYINDGTGGFTEQGETIRVLTIEGRPAKKIHMIALSDFDQDGDLDLFLGNDGSDLVFINDGAGSFSDSGLRLGVQDTRFVSVLDLDGDGDQDVIGAGYGAWVYFNE